MSESEAQRRSVFEARESERAVVGALLTGIVSFQDVELAPGEMTDLISREIFERMAALDAQGKPCDLAAVADAAPNLDFSLLVELAKNTPIYGVTSLEPYVNAIREAAMRRALSKLAQDTAALAANANAEPLKSAEEIRQKTDELMKNGPATEAKSIPEMLYEMHEWLFAKDPVDDAVKTGLGPLDALLGGGIRGSKLCIIGARPSVGKSALGLFIAQNAASSGKRVLIVSLEMDEREIFDRVLARSSLTDVGTIESRTLTPEDTVRVIEAYSKLSDMGLRVSTDATTPAKIRALALRLRAQQGLDLIVVDYLQLLQSGGKASNRTEEVGAISRQLKLLAMELKIPVVAMTQMNRQSEMGRDEGGRAPKMSESRESGSIEQDANQYVILHAPPRATLAERDDLNDLLNLYDGCKKNGWTLMQLIVAKNRNGRRGVVYVAFDAPHMRFLPFERNAQT